MNVKNYSPQNEQATSRYSGLYKTGVAVALAATVLAAGCAKTPLLGHYAQKKSKARAGCISRAPKISKLETSADASAEVIIMGPVRVGKGGRIKARASSGAELEAYNPDTHAPCGLTDAQGNPQ